MAAPVIAAAALQFANGMAGQARDAVQFRRQRILNQENNSFNAREAQKQHAAESALQRQQQEYNSEQAQVTRLRQAGLNPALLYGGSTSSSSLGSMSSASSSPSSYSPGGAQPDFGAAFSQSQDAELKRAQIQNLDTNTQSQGEDVVSKSTQNKYVDSKSNIELLQMVQQLENLKKQGALSDKDLQWYDLMKSGVLRQIQGQLEKWNSDINLNTANADYVSGAKTNETQANADYVSGAKTRETDSQANLNREKAKTEKTIRNLNISSEQRNYAERALAQSNIMNNKAVRDEILRKYGLSKTESDMINDACDKLGINKGFANGLLDCYGQFRQEFGKGIAEFFSGDNWITYLGRRYQANKMHGGQLDDLVDRGQPSGKFDDSVDRGQPSGKFDDAVDRDDVAKTVPSNKNYNSHVEKLWNDFPQQFKDEYAKGLPYMERNLDKHQFDEFKKDIYYEDDPQKVMEKFYYWYYKCKHNL